MGESNTDDATDHIHDDVAEAATSWASADEQGVHELAAPRVGGLTDAIERRRVFEALFDVRAEPQLLGRYVVQGVLGRGGMGVVLKAFDPALDRRVALKVLREELGERHAARLEREAQALARLSHPNVVQVYEVDQFDGRSFVAMELVTGQTLGQWMRQRPRPSWRECIDVFAQVGEGLAAAHAQGLVHRDFKPGNAVIDDQGRARVLDFGLARRVGGLEGELDLDSRDDAGEVDPAPLEPSLTNTGAVLGTPAYMPIEQMQGREADARSDQFSFCVALYEAIYGERPFEGSSMAALMVSMADGTPRGAPKGSRVPARLRAVLLRGLASHPDDRWASMEPLLAELRRLAAPRARRWVLAGAGLAVGLGIVGWGLA